MAVTEVAVARRPNITLWKLFVRAPDPLIPENEKAHPT
jgi:hypothetical protein